MNANERLKYLRTEILGISQEELGKVLGITKAGVSLIEKKQRHLTTKNINRICEYYKINRAWLLNGQGEIYSQLITFELQMDDSKIEIDFLQKYLRLTTQEKSMVKEYVEKLHKLHDMK